MSTDDAQGKFFIQNTMLLYAIGTIAAIARLGVKYYISRRFNIEEAIMFFSLICWTIDTVLIVITVEKGTNQVPEERRMNMPIEEVKRRVTGSKAFLGAWYAYTTAIWGCKVAILIFYKRLTDRVTQQRRIKFAAVVLLITYIVCILGVSLVCRPFKGLWQIYPNPGPACTDGYHFVFIVGILNIITDIMLLAIPMPLLRHLQVSFVRKFLLGCMFGLGIFVVIATSLRMYYTVVGGNISNMTFWSMIETATLFIVSNAPGIRAIFSRGHKRPCQNSNSRSFELHGSSKRNTNGHITTLVKGGGGDSTEHIIDSRQQSNMVIHQQISYNVTVECDLEEQSSISHQDVAPTRSSLSRDSGPGKN